LDKEKQELVEQLAQKDLEVTFFLFFPLTL